MAKKKSIEITPQKPMKDLDAFVHGDAPGDASAPPVKSRKQAAPSRAGSQKPLPRGARERKDGTVVRPLTIYLPVDLAKKLAVYCAENDMETSEVIAEGVRSVVG